MNWRCPACGYSRTTADDIVRTQHTCPHNAGELVQLVRGERVYEIYCGRCRELRPVQADLIPDGEVWICDNCLARAVAS